MKPTALLEYLPRSPWLALVACFLLFGANAVGGDFAVVVHPSNGYESVAGEVKATIRDLYLKNSASWPRGARGKAQPFGPPQGSPAYEAFLSSVLGMDETALARHWLAIKQRNGSSSPRSVPSASLLAKFLDRYPAGFGVVTRAEAQAHASAFKVILEF